ncbi:MAG TPA: hypothetical protein VKV73_07935 [Chloroflexota bacterium]|nr:hypothetical protein [Chloroflexota bacterium]
MRWFTRRALALGISGTLLAGSLLGAGTVLAASKTADFDLVVSKGGAACLPSASGEVHIRSLGPVEVMDVTVDHLLPKSDFDLFILQLPTAPFGVSWYQSDISTNENGHGHVRVIGRFSNETFAVAPGSGAAPKTFESHPVDDEGNSIASVDTNPPFGPVQMYHIGLWFNSPVDAENAGCSDAVTPFNGEHDAGIQLLNSSNFPNDQGPLSLVGN